MIEVTLPRTISLNERCTLLSHAICQIALLLDRVFASLSLLHEPTHPGNLFSFLLPTIRPPSPPRPTFTCSPQRILSNECNPFWTIDLRPPRFFLVSPKETFPRGIYDTHRCKFRLNRDG